MIIMKPEIIIKNETDVHCSAPKGMVSSICSVEGCGLKMEAKGFCDKHYRRWKKYGTPDPEGARYKREDGQWCPRCEEYKTFDEFWKDNRRVSGYQTYCKECTYAYRKDASNSLEPKRITRPKNAAPSICSVDGCEIVVCAQGFCDKHYRRFKKYGAAEPDGARYKKDGMNWCPGCEDYKSLDEFWKDSRRISGVQVYCKACTYAYRKSSPEKYQKKARDYYHSEGKFKYNKNCDLTADELRAAFEAAENKCEICGLEETGLTKDGHKRMLHVDHDHETGKFRGLLCSRCNTTLGSVKDDPELLRKMALYLEVQNQYSNMKNHERE